MTLNEFLGGVAILRKYADSEFPFATGHGVIHFYTDRPLTPDESESIRALGWFNEGDTYDADGETAERALEGTWSAFV